MRIRDYRKCRRPERGSIFVLALVILVVIFMLGASLIERSQNAVSRASTANRATVAFQLAEGGVHKALWSLSQPGGWLGYVGESGLALPGGSVDVGVAPAPAGRLMSTQQLTVIATGWVPGPGGTRRYPCTIRVLTRWEPNYFDCAIFGSEHVGVGNGHVHASTPGKPANIGTNAKGPKSIEIAPGGLVEGDVAVGYEATNPAACIDNKGIIGGLVGRMSYNKYLYSVPGLPPGTVELGDIDLSGGEIVLNPGIYHALDLDVSGTGKITCTGKVTIYVGQGGASAPATALSIGGNGIVNASMIPTNLTLYCFDNVATIDICGNGTLYGGVYAPKAVITLNSGNVYGSLVARDVAINGSDSQVFYDETMSDDSKPRATARSWEVL